MEMLVVTAPVKEEISRIQEALGILWENPNYHQYQYQPEKKEKLQRELDGYCFQIPDLHTEEDITLLFANLYARLDEERWFVIVAMDLAGICELLSCVRGTRIIEIPSRAVCIPWISKLSFVNRMEEIIEALSTLLPEQVKDRKLLSLLWH